MLSLSPALPPTALRVPGSTAMPASPGDFAAALAGLLVAPGGEAAPAVVPADRQMAAMPGKDLPAVAVAAGAIDPAPEAGTLADEAVSSDAMPLPAEAPQPPVLPAPVASPIAAPVDATGVDEAPPPIIPEPLPAPVVAPAPIVEREAIAPPMAGDAATPRTPPDKRAQIRKDMIAALPLPIPGATAIAPSITESVPIAPAVMAADGAMIDDEPAKPVAASTGETMPQNPDEGVLPHPAVPVAIDSSPPLPVPVTDSEPTGMAKRPVADDDRVVIDAADQTAIVESVTPAVAAFSTITATLDAAATSLARKAPTRPQRFVAPIAAVAPPQQGAMTIERPQALAPAIVTPTLAPVTASLQSRTDLASLPAGGSRDAVASTPIDGVKIVSVQSLAADSARPTPAAPDPAAPSAVRGQPHATAAPIVVAQASPLVPGARAVPGVVMPAARPAAPRVPVTEAAEPLAPIVVGHAPSPVTAPAEPAPALHRTPLDMRRDDWTRQLIDRIETVRDMANAADTRIKLMPDALGKIDVTMRKDGDTMHVGFTADVAQTRAMLAEAQPRLAELAQQRGLRLGQSSVDAGAGGHGQPGQPHQPGTARTPLPSRPMRAPEHDEDVFQTGRLA